MEFLPLEADLIDCHLLKAYVLKAQLTITCSKSTKKALEQVANHVQSKKQKHQDDITVVVLISSYLTLNMPCTYVSIVDFEQIFVCWEAL